MASRDNYLRALGLIADLEDQRLDTIPTLQTLEWNSFAAGEDGFGVTKIEDDGPVVHLLHDSGDEVSLPALIHLIDDLTFGLTQLELHDLLERLSGNPPESLAVGCVLPLVDDIAVLIELLGVDRYLSGFGIDRDPRLFGRSGTPFVGGDQGVGESIENRIDPDSPLASENLDGLHHRVELHVSPSVARLGGLLPPEHRLGGDYIFITDHVGAVIGLDREGVLVGTCEDPSNSCLRLTKRHFGHQLPAHRLPIVRGSPQVSLQTRRAHLELVLALQVGFVVEQPRQPLGEGCETINRDALAIHCDAKNPTLPLPGKLEIIQLESLRGEVGLHYIPDVGYLRHLCHSTTNQMSALGAHLMKSVLLSNRIIRLIETQP